jgi:NADH:ubiquinone oxidoreductase subunit 2 (subunit N)
MLIIAILIILLAATSSYNRSYKTLADYIKFNRIVFTVFILASYLAYNVIDLDVLNNGTLIWGGVFKINLLSQVFDSILLITGSLVSLLTCFIPYNYRKYYDAESMNYIIKSDGNVYVWNFHDNVVKSGSFYDYYTHKLLTYYTHNDFDNKSKFLVLVIKFMKKITESIRNFKVNTPFLVEKNLEFNRIEAKEFNLLLLFTVLGGSLLISSNNLISLYLSLELQSFSLYILSSSQIKSFWATSGGLKYFLLGGLSSGFILLGSSLLYGYTGALNFDDIFAIYSDGSTNYFIDPCLLILFAGLLFKISAAPFHNWAPDVYNQVPTNSATWLIVIAKISVLVLMLILVHNIQTALDLNSLSSIEQFTSIDNAILFDWSIISLMFYDLYINFKDLFNYSFILNEQNLLDFTFWLPEYSSIGLWTNVLTLSAILSLLIGTFVGVTQSPVKRLYAYSTISHVGFLLLALSINSLTSLDAFLFYLVQYSITNLNLFFILIAWGYIYIRYFREKEFVPIRYIKVNPFSLKDIYIDPTLYDFFESMDYELEESDKYNRHNYKDKNFEVNTILDYYLVHSDESHFTEPEDTEWIYSPVPYLINFKGMYKTDPMLAFCLTVTLLSLAGNFMECQSIYFKNKYLKLILYTKKIRSIYNVFHFYLFYMFLDQFVWCFYLKYLPRLNVLHILWSKSPIYIFIIRHFIFYYILFYNSISSLYFSYKICDFIPLYLYAFKKYPSYFYLIPKKKASISKSKGFGFYSNVSLYSTNLGPYLAGLIEGDGHIYVPDVSGKKYVPYIEIAFDIKDRPLFEKIQEKLGGGYFFIKSNNQSGRLTIKKKIVLIKLINLINGYMRTPKKEALHRLIDYLNFNNNLKLIKYEIDKSDVLGNSWLSGFLDADGNFYLNFKFSQVRSSVNTKIISIIYYMRLSQRQFYTRKKNPSLKISYFDVMNKIAKSLNTSVITITRKRINYEEHGYLIRTDKIISKNIIFSYLDKFPLFGYKYFSHKNIGYIHLLVKNNEYKTEKGKLKFIEYYEKIKYDLIRDSWNHLNQFYSK